MAGLNKFAKVEVIIGGVEQSKNRLNDLKKSADDAAKKVDDLKNALLEVDASDKEKMKSTRKDLKDAERELNALNKDIAYTEKSIFNVEKVLDDISGNTTRKLNETRASLRNILLGISPKDTEGIQAVKQAIKEIEEELSKRKGTLIEFSDIIGDMGNASDKSLSMVKQRLTELLSSTKLNSEEMTRYREEMAQVEAEERRRVNIGAKSTLSKVQTGTFGGTIADTKEAIKQLEQFKQQLKTSDVTGIKEVDDAILLLNGNLKQASTAAMSYDQAIEQAAQVKNGNFRGTYEDLERLRKTLQEYKAQLKVGDTAGLQKIKDAFKSIEEAEKRAKGEAVDVNRVLQNLKTAPMNDLKLAAAQLQEELNAASRETEDFIKKSAELRNVNKQIEDVNKSWKEQEASVDGVMKKFTSYLLMYVGFNEVLSRVRQLTQANLELSDSLGSIQKSTGLSAEAIAELSREIDSIDTRETQNALHSLAFEAGKIGLSSKTDILGFVKAGNEVITALGDELGGAQAITGLMKINALLGETARLGVEKSLKATGSAINELSNSSSAAAGPIADIISRLGSVGQVSKLTMADMAALGATADELSQEVEVSGTALSKFITAMQTNTRGIAQAVGIDEKEIQQLMDAGKTMEAMILVLQRMKETSQGGGMKEIAPLMKEFGSDGERLNRVITAFASNVDILQKRVYISRTAFDEAISVTNEYNVMNETAMALVQRLGNMITEAFVNSKFVGGIKSFLQFLMDIPNLIERNRDAFAAFKIVLTDILLLLASKYWGAFLVTLKSLASFVVGPFVAGWRTLSFELALAKERLTHSYF